MSSPRFAIQRSDVPRPVLATRAVGVVSERMLGVLTLACQAGGPRHRISGLPARIGVRTMTPLLLRLQSRSTEHHDSRPRALVPVMRVMRVFERRCAWVYLVNTHRSRVGGCGQSAHWPRGALRG